MTLWKVTADDFEYDQYDSFIVIADSKSEAEKLVIDYIDDLDIYYSGLFIQIWKAEKIPLNQKNVIIHESFNAG